MPKYRAKQDVPGTTVKKGDVVEFQEEIVDGYKNHFEPVGDDEEVTEDGDNDDEPGDLTANPDRNALKAKAEELGLNVAANIPTARLLELVKEAEEKKASEQ